MITFRPLPTEDLQHAIAIELASYPADEAADLVQLTHRQSVAGSAFVGCYSDDKLVGFVCGTCTTTINLEEESMSAHDRNGQTLAIHSVVVDEAHRRQGLATLMLRNYCATVPLSFPKVTQFRLISKCHLIHFYEHAGGFEFVQLWPYHHGQEHWFEMRLQLDVIRQHQVDAFVIANKSFSGNPAAVAIFPVGMKLPDDKWHSNVAAANALSETAFVQRRKDQPSSSMGETASVDYDLRWFTPTTEVDLCGHATLASAAALWMSGTADRDAVSSLPVSSIRFHTRRSGVLVATRDRTDSSGLITLNFPVDVSTDVRGTEEEKEKNKYLTLLVMRGLGLPSSDCVLHLHRGKFDVLVEVDETIFSKLALDMSALGAVPARGVIVTSVCSGDSSDFQSRWFGPQSGVPEDPVTGSAHCMLAWYWSKRLEGKTSMVGYQASERGGIVEVTLDEAGGRVDLSGRASIFSSGKLA
jgi:PhzF family phenazine biosynthesis protein